MYPSNFEYYRPSNLNEALELLANGECRPIAGGQSLVPLMKLRIVAPKCLVDLGRIESLRTIAIEGDVLKVGAMVTHEEIVESQIIEEFSPVLALTAESIGDLQVRNRGTIGGSLAHADPSANYLPTLLALEAEVVVVSPLARRVVPMADFVKGPYTTDLRQGELLEAVMIPRYRGRGIVEKFAIRKADFAIGLVTMLYKVIEGKLDDLRLAVGALATGPVRLRKVEEKLRGGELNPKAAEDVLKEEVALLQPVDDIHGGAEYRRRVIFTLVKRMLEGLARGEGQ
ncbi:carbon monoxide dehydrogenase [Sulfodiicoccus acidiphilus]|uniref:Carbon monoxide dehydrogenase n=1 Tax=Sulfodiicoccus acidiphilus TaxID=1670455 RepID=A0A830H0G4_9CREN|nr:xanthine dehydrogenase family protein subunit M [Sulfodiicoccus acidiphilus]GGT94635.1 carbon monoxide dehydrogenase [Sulfodiicoccus acidiphilus]